MFTILTTDGWEVLDHLVQSLIPIAIVVVLPVLVVWLVMRTRQHEVDRKTEILMKSIENGAELSPDFFNMAKRPKSVKDKLMGYLTTAMVTGVIGLITMLAQVVYYSTANLWEDKSGFTLVFLCISGVILAVGIAFLVVYFVGKKTCARELAELER
ncbi:MAG: hypothetical protein J6Y63_05425 [Bacteroidales bacterium]|nr:hypothetical protein [Bacteroidales bacterium]